MGRERESLIDELREIERMDAEYYRQQGSDGGDVNPYTVRQQRRNQILRELVEHNLRGQLRLSLSIDVILFCLRHRMIKGRISEISASGFTAVLPLELQFELPIGRWTTGANCSATAPPLPPCSIVSSITAMYSNAVHGVGARKQTCLHTRRRSKTT